MSKYLLEYEKTEILDYDLIYFLNINERKTSRLKTPEGVENCGFDNDKNEYLCEMGDHIAYRYEVMKRLGKGSFG